MGTSLTPDQQAEVLDRLSLANQAFVERYPGDSPKRQPLHTVYGGAQLFKATTANKLGELANRSLDAYAPNAPAFARALELPGAAELPDSPSELEALAGRYVDDPDALRMERPGTWLAYAVYERVRDKLAREPVEDFRIDFEDGFGVRPDAEEDATAERAAMETARGMSDGLLPPFIGIRIKPLNEEMKERSIRTLDLYLSTLVGETGGILPDGFVVTLPKVTIPEQVSCLVAVFEQLEGTLELPPGTLQMEIMIETTQSMFDPAGRSNLPHLLDAARGRCVGAHFGTYDYTASCNITAAYQAMDHPVCDFAKHMMQVTLSGTGIFLSDGATNVMPVGPHSGSDLSPTQRQENQEVVHRAWRLAYSHVRHSLEGGYYQGWDLHPAQLPVRYGACFGFFLEHLDQASERLSNFIDKAAQATLVGDVFDDAATGQGLLNYFLRALNSGAITELEVQETGLSLAELRTRSFMKILEGRRTT